MWVLNFINFSIDQLIVISTFDLNLEGNSAASGNTIVAQITGESWPFVSFKAEVIVEQFLVFIHDSSISFLKNMRFIKWKFSQRYLIRNNRVTIELNDVRYLFGS